MQGHDALLVRIREIAAAPEAAAARLLRVCELMRAELAGYDWVGFYLVDTDADRELVLGPFAGAPTDHLRIPFGSGICGQAAETEETFVVDDVTAIANYLSCGDAVKSEIVVPVFQGGRLVAELDIDSHARGNFGDEDRLFCEAAAALLGDVVAEAVNS